MEPVRIAAHRPEARPRETLPSLALRVGVRRPPDASPKPDRGDRAMKITIDRVELAQFTPEDTRLLYDIRNHDSVRSFMSNSAPLEYEKHEAWVKKNLIDGRGFLLLLVRVAGRGPIGFTLLQRKSPDTAEIGVIFREAA